MSLFLTITESNNHLVDELKERTTVMQATTMMLHEQNRVNNLFQMIEMYCTSGNTAKADEFMMETERFIMVEQWGDKSSRCKIAFSNINSNGDALTENAVENIFFEANRSSSAYAEATMMNNTVTTSNSEHGMMMEDDIVE